MRTLVVVSCNKVVYCKAVDFVGWSPQLVKKGLGVILSHLIERNIVSVVRKNKTTDSYKKLLGKGKTLW